MPSQHPPYNLRSGPSRPGDVQNSTPIVGHGGDLSRRGINDFSVIPPGIPATPQRAGTTMRRTFLTDQNEQSPHESIFSHSHTFTENSVSRDSEAFISHSQVSPEINTPPSTVGLDWDYTATRGRVLTDVTGFGMAPQTSHQVDPISGTLLDTPVTPHQIQRENAGGRSMPTSISQSLAYPPSSVTDIHLAQSSSDARYTNARVRRAQAEDFPPSRTRPTFSNMVDRAPNTTSQRVRANISITRPPSFNPLTGHGYSPQSSHDASRAVDNTIVESRTQQQVLTHPTPLVGETQLHRGDTPPQRDASLLSYVSTRSSPPSVASQSSLRATSIQRDTSLQHQVPTQLSHSVGYAQLPLESPSMPHWATLGSPQSQQQVPSPSASSTQSPFIGPPFARGVFQHQHIPPPSFPDGGATQLPLDGNPLQHNPYAHRENHNPSSGPVGPQQRPLGSSWQRNLPPSAAAVRSNSQLPGTAPSQESLFDWQKLETLLTRFEGALNRVEQPANVVSRPRSSVTFTEPVDSVVNSEAWSEGHNSAHNGDRYSKTPPSNSHIPTCNVDSKSSSDSDYSYDDSHSSSNSYSSGAEYTRSRKHRHRSKFREQSSAKYSLSEADITVLTKQGVPKRVLRQRQQQQMHNSTSVQDLPDIPPTQFVVQMSADSVPKFSGNMEDYERFRELFLAYAQALPVSIRLMNLKLKLDLNSQNAVAGCIGQDKKSFERAMDILDIRNNKKDLLINILVSKIDSYFEYQYDDDDKFINMVSNIQAFHNRILNIDPLQITTLNGLTSRFTKCLPNRPYYKVSNLMGKVSRGVACYNFQKVLRICEKHVDWLTNQKANRRAIGQRSRPSRGLNSPSRFQGKPQQDRSSYYNKGRQSVYSTSDYEDLEKSESPQSADSELIAATHVADYTSPSADKDKPAMVDPLKGRSRQRGRSLSSSRSAKVGDKGQHIPARSRSRSRPRERSCTLCQASGHIPKDCTSPPANLLEFVDSNKLCRVCLLRGHFAYECPILLCCPGDIMICQTPDCDRRPHSTILCHNLKCSK